MDLRIATPLHHTRQYPGHECAQCGAMIRRPDWSEYCDDRRVKHLWECEACGYSFETQIRLRDAA